jgi:hypothetical protein
MNDLFVQNVTPNICYTPEQITQGFAVAQAQIITSAGQAEMIFLGIGIIIGAAFVAVLWYGKLKIDEAA